MRSRRAPALEVVSFFLYPIALLCADRGILNLSSLLSEDCRTRGVRLARIVELVEFKPPLSEDCRLAKIIELSEFVDAWLFVLGCGWHFGLAAAGWHSLGLTEAG